MAKKEEEKDKGGRPHSEDKVVREFIYFRESVVKKNGGWKELKEKIYRYIQRTTKK